MARFDNSCCSFLPSSVPAPQQETDENQTSHLGRKLSFACQAFITVMCYLLPISAAACVLPGHKHTTSCSQKTSFLQ